MQISQSYKTTPFHLWRTRGGVFEMVPFPEACSVPVLCVFLLFLQSSSVLTFGACILAKKWRVIGNNSLLPSIRCLIQIFLSLFHWLLVSHRCGDAPGVYYLCWCLAQVLRFRFTLHCEIGKSYNSLFLRVLQRPTTCSAWWRYEPSMRWSSKNVWQKRSYTRLVSGLCRFGNGLQRAVTVRQA